ncbi:hypothetical protein ACROYT_G002337 [Oculina patagonica]
MDDIKKSQQKPFSFKNLPHVMMDSVDRFRTALQRFIEAILAIISSVTNFFVGIFATVSSAYERVAMLSVFMVDWVRQIFRYDYLGYFTWLLRLPKEYYTKCKEQTRKYVWMPVANAFTRKVNRISRAFETKLRESAVYVRGFCELCRRLFLLTSDYTPGGKYTVTAFLLVVAIIFFLKILTVVRVIVQILELAYSIVAFLLYPLLLTLRDILSIFDPLFQIVLFLVRIIAKTVLSSLKAIGFFVWLNLISIASGLYRCWLYFINSAIVRLVWSLFAKTGCLLLEKFIFVFLPFMTKITYYVGTFSFDVSSVAYSWLYPWFIRGFIEVSVNVDRVEYLTPSGIGSGVLIFWALLLAFRYRNRLSGTFFSEIDGKQYAIRSSNASCTDRSKKDIQKEKAYTSGSRSTTKYDSSRRKTTSDESSLRNRGKATRTEEREHTSDNGTEGHIHYSSQVHICTDYIAGICQQGSKCDTHHCPLPYHWQYRLSLEGWKSFSLEDNCRIEELFCDPKNDNITSTEIDLVVKSYRETNASSQRKDAVKLDFESMRIQESYHRADIRRLSTESYVKEQDNCLTTQWLWYRKEESRDWVKYGEENESDTKQEDLESAFLRREGNYNFTRDGQEFRLQFFLNPMCEKSFRPYSKKIVRRRPVFRSPEDIQKLTRGNVEKTSWFSFKKLFRWR